MTNQKPGSDGISLTVHGAIGRIVLERKGRLNALRLRTWLALPALMDQAERAREVGVIIVQGAHGNFGAGNDISELTGLAGDPAAAEEYGRAAAEAMLAVEAVSKPVIMAMEGVCYGASVALALAGDLRIAADDARFAITPAKLGAVYLRSDLHRLVAAIGVGQSRMLLYLGEPIGAEQALNIGLVDHLLPSIRFESHLQAFAERMLGGAPSTLHRTKLMLRDVCHARTPAETTASLAWFVDATQSADFREGTAAFLTKRKPKFR